MPVSSINRVKSITLPLNSSSGSDIVTVYENTGLALLRELLPNYKIVAFNCFLKNLKAFASITSLEEAPLPDFSLEDSDTQKLVKTLDVEWGSPRKQLNLYISSGGEWFQIGSVSLLNPYGYPFRIYNLMDLLTDNLAAELGENSKIGVSVQNVGHGLLEPQDKVTIHGSYTEEVFLESSDPPTYITVPVTIPPITVNVSGGYTSGSGSGSTPGTTPIVSRDYSIGNNSSIDNSFLARN